MNNLEYYRERADMTRDELAWLLGVQYHTIRSWELGRTRPREYQIQRIADVLHCTADELDLSAFAFKPIVKKKSKPTENKSELAALIDEINKLGRPCLREVLAFLGPETERYLLQRLYEGKISDDDMDMMRRVIEKHRERIE